jgi:prepilin-type N-terminal cleavage/methylation domain-containing protein
VQSQRNQFRSLSAFTLIELLMVIAVVALLAAAGMAMGQSMIERAKYAQAHGDLAALSAALEAYRQTFGDYPRTAANAEFLQSLIGKRGPTGASVSSHAFIDTVRLSISADPFSTAAAECLDPWDQPYHYAYRSSTPWTHPGFVLFSSGADRTSAPLLAGGEIDDSAISNRDDVFIDR